MVRGSGVGGMDLGTLAILGIAGYLVYEWYTGALTIPGIPTPASLLNITPIVGAAGTPVLMSTTATDPGLLVPGTLSYQTSLNYPTGISA